MNFVPNTQPTPEAKATLMETTEVARWLGVSAALGARACYSQGAWLRAIRVGKLLRFRPEDIEEFLRRSGQ